MNRAYKANILGIINKVCVCLTSKSSPVLSMISPSTDKAIAMEYTYTSIIRTFVDPSENEKVKVCSYFFCFDRKSRTIFNALADTRHDLMG